MLLAISSVGVLVSHHCFSLLVVLVLKSILLIDDSWKMWWWEFCCSYRYGTSLILRTEHLNELFLPTSQNKELQRFTFLTSHQTKLFFQHLWAMRRRMLHIGTHPTMWLRLCCHHWLSREINGIHCWLSLFSKIKSGFKLSVTAIQKQRFQFLEFTDHIYSNKQYAL